MTESRRRELDAWRVARIRDLEREVDTLKAYRAQLERLLGLACQVAAGKTSVDPLVLLAVLEELDQASQEAADKEQVAA